LSIKWAIAIESLSWIELERLNEDAAVRKTLKQLRIYDRDQANEAKRLVYETIRRLNAIDFLVSEALRPNNLGNLKIGLRSFLRLFTYLVHYSDGSLVQAYELVDYTRELLGKKEYKLVRDVPEIILSTVIPYDEITDIQKLAYTYFHPPWYIEKLVKEFGETQTKKLLQHVDYPRYLRLNTLKSGPASLDKLYEKGYQLVKEPGLPETYRLLDGENITATEEYKKGHFIIQDKASVLAGIVADPKPGDVVLDVCAAPGAKTSHYAQQMKNMGRIISVDFNRRRLQNWERLMERLGVTNATPVHADASKPGALPRIEADIVTVDPPCSGAGLFHRSPASKWRLTSRSVERMAELQKRILLNASKCLRPGGVLVYTTCSITVEENEEVVQSLLDKDPCFHLVEASPRLGDPGLHGMREAQRLYPYRHVSNGFFIAKLMKDT